MDDGSSVEVSFMSEEGNEISFRPKIEFMQNVNSQFICIWFLQYGENYELAPESLIVLLDKYNGKLYSLMPPVLKGQKNIHYSITYYYNGRYYHKIYSDENGFIYYCIGYYMNDFHSHHNAIMKLDTSNLPEISAIELVKTENDNVNSNSNTFFNLHLDGVDQKGNIMYCQYQDTDKIYSRYINAETGQTSKLLDVNDDFVDVYSIYSFSTDSGLYLIERDEYKVYALNADGKLEYKGQLGGYFDEDRIIKLAGGIYYLSEYSFEHIYSQSSDVLKRIDINENFTAEKIAKVNDRIYFLDSNEIKCLYQDSASTWQLITLDNLSSYDCYGLESYGDILIVYALDIAQKVILKIDSSNEIINKEVSSTQLGITDLIMLN